MACECSDKPKKDQNRQAGKVCTNQLKAHVVKIQGEEEDKPPTYKNSVPNIFTTICAMMKEK
jgi:hypothetical protein